MHAEEDTARRLMGGRPGPVAGEPMKEADLTPAWLLLQPPPPPPPLLLPPGLDKGGKRGLRVVAVAVATSPDAAGDKQGPPDVVGRSEEVDSWGSQERTKGPPGVVGRSEEVDSWGSLTVRLTLLLLLAPPHWLQLHTWAMSEKGESWAGLGWGGPAATARAGPPPALASAEW